MLKLWDSTVTAVAYGLSSKHWHFTIFFIYIQLIEEETGPKLERLKKERDSYIEYQKIVRDIEHLNKLYVAWQVCGYWLLIANLAVALSWSELLKLLLTWTHNLGGYQVVIHIFTPWTHRPPRKSWSCVIYVNEGNTPISCTTHIFFCASD